MQQINIKKVVGLVISGIIALVILAGGWYVVPAGSRGVIIRGGGSVIGIADSGFHFKVPVLDTVKKLSVQTQKEQVETDAASQDLQTVKAIVAVNYNINVDKVEDLYKSIGTEYKSKVIDPAIQEAVKAATAKYTAEQLITQRPQVKDDIKLSLSTILAPKDIVVSDVSITNFDFSPSFNAAIESKVTAEQQALQAKNKLEQVKYEKEQVIAKAQGEAESIRIQAQAITSQGGDNYVQLKALEKWDGKLPQQFIPGSAMPFINLK